MEWYNEPPRWTESDGIIAVTAGAKIDFWRITRHNFIADNGHFYFQPVTGNFQAQVKVTGQYAALYDQAGLMLRASETTWMKCGIEYLEGVQQASTVITREFSDWSVLPLINHPVSAWFRVNRYGSAIEVSYSLDGTTYSMIREAYLTETPTLQVGLMIAAPKGEGFQATFEHFSVQPRQE